MTLVASTRLIRSALRLSTVHWVNRIPALLTSAVSGSPMRSIASNIAITCASSLMSARSAVALPPDATMVFTTSVAALML